MFLGIMMSSSAMRRPRWTGRVRRYAIVGSLGGAVYAASVWLMTDWGAIKPLTASSIAFFAVVALNYQLHYRWTFVSEKHHAVAFSQFLIASGVGFAANYGILYCGLLIAHINYIAVQITAIGVVILLNFLLGAFWVFRG